MWEFERLYVEFLRTLSHKPSVPSASDNIGRRSYHFAVSDVFTKAKRSKIMAAVRSRGNKATELKLAAMLRAGGLTGWQRHAALPGRPDFVFREQRLAIFVDGCFWHGCRWHCRIPEDNREYWERKISRNVSRDRSTTKLLRQSGWRVLRIWAHSLRSPEIVLGRITSELRRQAKACNNAACKDERKNNR